MIELINMQEELYYWTTRDGEEIPKHELTDLYVCHIVMCFGKEALNELGHKTIVSRFEELNKKYDFFKELK